jgi:hypothetical protein
LCTFIRFLSGESLKVWRHQQTSSEPNGQPFENSQLAVSVQAVHGEEFDYLDAGKNLITTTHQMAYQVRINSAFKPLGELHHRQESNGHAFRVSLAAFMNGADIIMIHAETLEEGIGILNYEHLPRIVLSGVEFGVREQCIPVEAEASLRTNPEAIFLRDRGFTLELPFLLTQHLSASSDGNAEIVIAYGRTVESCANITNALRSDTRDSIDDSINVKPIN